VPLHPHSPDLTELLGIDLSYRQYREELRRHFAHNSRNSADVEDLVQEVYARLLKYRPREPIKDPRAYLFQIAQNVLRAAKNAERTQNQRYLSCPPEEIQKHAESVNRLWIEEDGGTQIAEAEISRVMNQLPPPCCAALILHRRDGLSYEQIARRLGVSVNTVKDYLVKAYLHFRLHYRMNLKDRPPAKDR
jgi:RNA polymerase sigma-70 factor (ECF subfamily)